MAEILLEPSSRSKIIPLSFNLNDTSASNAAQLMTKRQFNTADTDAWFQVTLDGFLGTAGSFDITLFNLNDKSVFNHTGKPFTTNPFYYKLDSESDETTNEIRHAGRWIGQIVVTLANGDSATRKFIFDIEGHILDGADVQTILLEDYNALIATINTSKDLLAQYNVDYAALLVDLAAAETTRTATYNQLVADQQANIDAFDVALETGIVAANLAEKLEDFEEINNSRLLSTERQLAEADTEIVGTNLRIDSLIIPLSPENANLEVTNALTSVVKGKAFTTLSNRIEEAEVDFKTLVDSELNENHIIRSVPNGVSDYYDSSLGVFKKNVGHTVLDGGETFDSFVSTSTNVYKMMITGWVTAENAVKGNVTTFEAVNADSTLDKIAVAIGGGGLLVNTIALSGDALHLYLEKTKVDAMVGATLLDRCKQYLTSKPIDLKYQLVTGVDINLPNELSANTQWIIKAFGELTLLSSALIYENETWEV